LKLNFRVTSLHFGDRLFVLVTSTNILPNKSKRGIEVGWRYAKQFQH
jgi:hypothetical protein